LVEIANFASDLNQTYGHFKEDLLIEAYRPEADSCLASARMGGLVLAAAQGDGPPQALAIGADAAGIPFAADTLFTGASVTKLATALAVLRLADVGALALDDPLAEHLPDAEAARPGVTLRRILSHSAGLAVDVRADRAPYRPGLSWPILAAACLAEPPVAAPGSLVQYGNHGYGLIAVMIERISGLPFAAALQDLVLGPLRIEGYLGVEPPRAPALLADVRGNDPPELAAFNSAFYRSLALPWAGLVTTAVGALVLVRAFAGRPAGFVSPDLLADACSSQTDGLAGGAVAPLWYPACPWGVGPDIRGQKQPHWSPSNAAPESFGHAGASGCIVWHDPASDLSYAIFGARTAANGWILRHSPALGAALISGGLR
jgi:beta-lactamase class C